MRVVEFEFGIEVKLGPITLPRQNGGRRGSRLLLRPCQGECGEDGRACAPVRCPVYYSTCDYRADSRPASCVWPVAILLSCAYAPFSSCIHRLPCCQSCRSVSPPIPLSSGSCLPQCSLVPAPPTVSGETRVPLGMWLSLALNMPLLLLRRRGAYGAQCSVSAVRHSAACTCVIKGCVSIVFSLGGPVQ